ncbi:MAG: hypothetical protein J5527_01870 [Treponema sp.]|nr:hypothetical protein [Treponema sp.]
MKKTHGNKKMHFNAILFCVCLLFLTPLLCTCGLDKYEYIEAPETLYHRPYETSTFEDKYFEFTTKESKSTMFKGTAVYYRIYNSLSKMNTDVGTITNYIYSEDNKAKAAEKLLAINEKNQGFKPLLWENYNESILVSGGDVHNVKIRLSDYQYTEGDNSPYEDHAFMAQIIFDGNIENLKRPVRYTENLTFNFGRSATETKSRIPIEDDLDVCYSETTSEDDENRWYVPMFAIGVAMDESYTFNYSVPLYLGFVIIYDNLIDN